MERNIYLKEEKLWAAFKMFDKDGNGKISAAELRDVLGSINHSSILISLDDENFKSDLKVFEQMIKEADLNGDGEIDYNEFLKMMTANK
jgi:calcium-dependent protein kinase